MTAENADMSDENIERIRNREHYINGESTWHGSR